MLNGQIIFNFSTLANLGGGFVSVKQRGESRDVDQQVVAVLGPSHWLVLRKRSPVWALGDRWSNPKEVINREKFDLMVDN